jgi:predicted NUDIX family phosphoesterase
VNQENVLVVPASGIKPLLAGSFSSVRLDRCLDYILANYSFRSRAIVENDPGFKQIIPYVLVRHQGSYLMTRRTNRQTESRLHGKYSVGIGGHINDAERCAEGENILQAGLERELAEEIRLDGTRRSLELVGLISDDSTPVGQVHLGLVYLLETGSPDYSVQEPDLMTAEWAGVELLRERCPQMESWSQLAFEHVIAPAAARREAVPA